MLPKQNRLNSLELQEVLKSGRSLYSNLLSFKYISVKGVKTSKFNFVVSTKVSKTAPKRNFLKRRGRHVIYKNLDNIKTGYRGVFFFKPEAKNVKFKQFEDDLLNLLKKANLLK